MPDIRDLESKVCDTADMLHLAVDFFERHIRIKGESDQSSVEICKWEAEIGLFALYQAHSLMRTLREGYFQVLEGKADV